jgi:CRISPR-associated protein Cmr6
MRLNARRNRIFGKYHAGLAYQSLAPTEEDGKVPNTQKASWFKQVVKSKPHPDYKRTYDAWHHVVHHMGVTAEAKTTTPLLIGVGQPSAVEVGLTIHPTWGVPYIPGSALKGLLAHYIMATYGPDEVGGYHPDDPNHPEPDRAPFQGVTWGKSRIVHGPGAVYRALFGSPTADSDEEYRDSDAMVGQVIFHDALMKPIESADAEGPYMRDVVNPHVSTYYREGEWPNDRENPIPVFFLSVRPQLEFTLALGGDLVLQKQAMGLLKDALIEWGIGAKTRAGYGRLEIGREMGQVVAKTEILTDLETMLSDGDLTKREKLERFESTFLEPLRASKAKGNQVEVDEALRLCRKEFSKPAKWKKAFKAFNDELSG